MRDLALICAAAALAAGPALAQGTFNGGAKSGGYGTFSPGAGKPKSYEPNAYDAPKPAEASGAKPKSSTDTGAGAFRPYEPWKPSSTTSVFGPDGKPKKK